MALAYRLQARYPGLFVRVGWNDHVKQGFSSYRGWYISFEAEDPRVLVQHGLVAEGCVFGESRGTHELCGVHWWTHPIIDDSKRYGVSHSVECEPREMSYPKAPLTKTCQAQIMRMLKPFIRGTWRPRQPA